MSFERKPRRAQKRYLGPSTNPRTGGHPAPGPRAGLPKAPGLQGEDEGKESLKALYMQKKRRR